LNCPDECNCNLCTMMDSLDGEKGAEVLREVATTLGSIGAKHGYKYAMAAAIIIAKEFSDFISQDNIKVRDDFVFFENKEHPIFRSYDA